jgi:hypothetical protein
MASGGHIERLACSKSLLFRFAIRECKPAVDIVLKNRDAVGMRVHHRLFVWSVIDSEYAHLSLLRGIRGIRGRRHGDGTHMAVELFRFSARRVYQAQWCQNVLPRRYLSSIAHNIVVSHICYGRFGRRPSVKLQTVAPCSSGARSRL